MNVLILGIASLAWAGITVIVFFLWRIARFYEQSSEESAHSWLFLFPMVLLPLGAAFYMVYDVKFVGFPSGDLLLFGGGISLLLAAILLQQIMMGER